MSTLIRETFKTSRLAEFCSQKELVNQTSHEVEDWPSVIIKELADNGLDGCEEAGIAPVITVTVNADGIMVTDNGPGIDAGTVADITDYTSRTSSREAYVSPTRGAQGNALKTVLAMPFALDGNQGTVVIESRGVTHTIVFTVDRIRQEPRIEHTQAESSLTVGTKIAVAWPHVACSILADARPQIVPIVSNFACLNPHATITLEFGKGCDVGAGQWSVPATNSDWSKWRPSDPTSPHWYDTPRLAGLIGANIARAQDRHEPVKTVRDFVGEFKGLTRTQTRAAVCDAVDAKGWSLDQFLGNGTDLRRTGKLLEAMKIYSTPIAPRALGAIGQKHLAAKFESFGVDLESFEYKTAVFDCRGIPYLVEAAFGYCPEGGRRRIITDINWSVAIGDPFRALGVNDESLGEILTERRAGQYEPIVFALHVACPRIDYLDRGKSAIALPDVPRETIVKLVEGVTKRWTKQRKAEERDDSARESRIDRMLKRQKMTQKAAAALVLEAAYLKVSEDGKLPANARQIYYAARPRMLELTGKTTISQPYFSQVLMVDFMLDNEELCADWDVVFDDRGHFEEPHDGQRLGLGTLAVRAYLKGNHDLAIKGAGFKDVKIDTHGADGRFGALLFIEKEGFRDLLKSVQLVEKYDIAIMSSKDVSVTAARQLADALCHERGIPLEDRGTRRIELNALTSRQFVDLIERRLDENGITKIIPDVDDLAEAFRAYARAPKIEEAIEKAIADVPDDTVEVPADLAEQVRAYLEEHPECPWEEAVAAIVEDDQD